MNIAAIITAAGSSSRMGAGIKKEYRMLPGSASETGDGITVLGAAVRIFATDPRIAPIVVVHPASLEQGEFAARSAIGKELLSAAAGRILFIPGGENRRISVFHGLTLLNAWKPELVLIHDGARPWVERDLIDRVIEAALLHGAAVPALSLTETPKLVQNGFIEQHLKRTAVLTAQTPQGFSFEAIFAAHQKAAQKCYNEEIEYTDDAEIYGEFAGKTAVVAGDILNRKITFPGDL